MSPANDETPHPPLNCSAKSSGTSPNWPRIATLSNSPVSSSAPQAQAAAQQAATAVTNASTAAIRAANAAYAAQVGRVISNFNFESSLDVAND